MTMPSAQQALEWLKQGNQAFVDHIRAGESLAAIVPPAKLIQQQQPGAVILGCSDARVPAEIVFNQGIGDLFVIRVAGNIAAPPEIGSIEFAATEFGTRLVVVLGHTQCGAIRATLDAFQAAVKTPSPNLQSIVDAISPSVHALLDTDPGYDRSALAKAAVRANIQASMDKLRGCELLARLVQEDGLKIVGAEYAVETGQVSFFDDA